MARGRIENKSVENNMSRQQVTFCKRRNGLLKKTYELCAVVALVALVVVFPSGGRFYERVRQQQVISSPLRWTLVWFLLWSVLPVESVTSDWEFYCGNETFGKNDQYEKSLNNIAEKLPAEVSLAPSYLCSKKKKAPSYFHSLSSSSEPELIYAAGLCREDSSPTVCKICIRQAFQGVGARCPFRKVAAIVYDSCSLWMSNREFVDLNFNRISFSRYNTSRAPVERGILGTSVVGLVRAVAAETTKSAARFAMAQQQIVGAANTYTLYAFAQCIPRVMSDCKFCLEDLISSVFLTTSVGGESTSLWCQFRWELYPFITGVTPLFIPRVSPTEGKHGSEHQWKQNFVILSAVVGSAVLAILIVSPIVYIVQRRNKRRLQEHSSTTTRERPECVETTSLEQKRLDPETGEGSHSKPLEEPMGDACSRMDLRAIHQILVTRQYKDEEVSTELSFDGWAQQTNVLLDIRKRGDYAFENNDFRTAINCYSQFIDDVETTESRTVYIRRSLCYLICDQPDGALRDAMIAQSLYPEWPTAFYMQSVALSKMDMQSDAVDMLNKASQLEETMRQKSTQLR